MTTHLISSPLGCALLVLTILTGSVRAADDFELPPINYSKARPDNGVTVLQGRLDGGKAKLKYDEDHGYLKSLLKELDVPQSSQVLVFSKTSLQRNRIGPKTPRALYFNDDTYVGFCRSGDVLEVSIADPKLGAVFYTLDQEKAARPRFKRQTDNCLQCHASTLTGRVPGHLVRSVYPDDEGFPLLSLGTTRVDHGTAFSKRWGGWYVTGTSGKQSHLGNLVLPRRTREAPADNKEGVNVTDLRRRFTVGNYLTAHSDLVALMVLEHQVEAHNRITRARYDTLSALHQQEEFDRILKRKTKGLSDSTIDRIKSACEPLVEYLLFSGEAKLTEKVAGTSKFAAEFTARGPKDKQGRTLRAFDLKRRLFAYPCSYLIYSKAFDGLPDEAKSYIYRRLREVLTGKDRTEAFAHLSATDRKAVLEILRATKKGLPADWK